ncbi:MAG TPA: hypothetical protein VJ979_14935 [Actinomycetota bacterium]|nr:hypothetical protein [Actinomycetota bacterium]
MRTRRREEPGNAEADGQAMFSAGDPRPAVRRRAGTLVFLALMGALAWFGAALLGQRGGAPAPTSAAASDAATARSLPAGIYRLPGMSVPVTVTLPAGWSAGDSIWGPAGEGAAVLSTGRPGATTSVAVLDLHLLMPFDGSTNVARARPADREWFHRSIGTFRARVVPRLRDLVVGHRGEWEPPPALSWLLTMTDRGPIRLALDVTYAGHRGDLVSFSFLGERRPLFEMPGGGTIDLRPGTTYTVWAAHAVDPPADAMMLAVAREPGAVPGIEAWDAVRSLELGA